MITRAIRIQLTIFVLLTVVGVAAAGVAYVGVGDTLLGGQYTVRADFADAGGVFEGAEVTYRGVSVGRVDSLTPTTTGVRIALRLDRGTKIPADTRAVVANRSAIGEQHVDLQPATTRGPFLAGGSTIPRARTAVPISTSKLLYDLDNLVNSVPKKDLTTVIDELGQAFDGTGRDLTRLVDSGNELIEAADANTKQTIDLIERGRTVLRTQREQSGAIRSFAKDLADLSGTLADSDKDLRTTLDAGVASAHELEALIEQNRSDVPVLLGNLVTTGQIVEARLPGVQQILILYPYVVRGGYTVIAKDPKTGHYTAHFGLQLSLGPEACRKGYESTKKRVPTRTGPAATNTKAGCDDPTTTMRGSDKAPAPGPGDPGPTTAPTPSIGPNDGRDPAPSPGPPHDPSDTGSGSDNGSSSTDSSSLPPLFAPYDPTSGLAQLPDGSTARLGGQGGQQRVFGQDSWKWLLIGPLAQ